MSLFLNVFETRGQTGNTIDAYTTADTLSGLDLIMWVIPMGAGIGKLIVRNIDDPTGPVLLYLEATLADIKTVLEKLGVNPAHESSIEPIYRKLVQAGLDHNDALGTACAIARAN